MPKVKTVIPPQISTEGKRLTPETRQNQLIALAYDLVEARLRNGTATSQETTHFLKMGSPRARLEEELLKKDCELREAKIENMEREKRIEALYEDAIAAVKDYRRFPHDEIEEDIYDEDI